MAAQFCHQVVPMGLDRSYRAVEKSRGWFCLRQSVAISRSLRVKGVENERVVFQGGFHNPIGNDRAQINIPAEGRTNGIDQVRRRFDLEHVTLNAGAQRRENVMVIFVPRHQNGCADTGRGFLVQRRCRLAWHRDVDKRDVRMALTCPSYGLAAIGSLCGDFEAFLREHSLQTSANHGVVIGNQ